MSQRDLPPHRIFTVDSEHDGWRLDRFLAQRLPRLTRSKAAKICRTAVWCDPPRKIKPAMSVREGDRICLRRPDVDDGTVVPIPTVVYREERLWVLNKPAGLLVHPTATRYNTTLSQMLKQGVIEGCPQSAEPVHRLDRDTSGLLLIGLDKAAVTTLRAMFASEQGVTKRYLAVVHDPDHRWSSSSPDTLLDTPLGFVDGAKVGIRVGRGEWLARTRIRVLARQRERAVLECQLETGRQHQIRVHLALEETPIVGDKLYQMGEAFFLSWADSPGDPALTAQLTHPRHALHAASLGWRCPWSGDPRQINSSWPGDFPWEGEPPGDWQPQAERRHHPQS